MNQRLKYLFIPAPLSILFLLSSFGNDQRSNQDMNTNIFIKAGNQTFTASLADNPTAAAFRALLPLKLNMTELNNNEKYADLDKNLPTNASRPSSIQAGDLMLYGSRTLVLFYQTFSTNYTYTRIGQVVDPAGLAKALGKGDVLVTIEKP